MLPGPGSQSLFSSSSSSQGQLLMLTSDSNLTSSTTIGGWVYWCCANVYCNHDWSFWNTPASQPNIHEVFSKPIPSYLAQVMLTRFRLMHESQTWSVCLVLVYGHCWVMVNTGHKDDSLVYINILSKLLHISFWWSIWWIKYTLLSRKPSKLLLPVVGMLDWRRGFCRIPWCKRDRVASEIDYSRVMVELAESRYGKDSRHFLRLSIILANPNSSLHHHNLHHSYFPYLSYISFSSLESGHTTIACGK